MSDYYPPLSAQLSDLDDFYIREVKLVMFVDPGPLQSGVAIIGIDNFEPIHTTIMSNDQLLAFEHPLRCVVGIEMPVCYGGKIGASTLHTCRVVGQLQQSLRPLPVILMSRPEVLRQATGQPSAKKGAAWEVMVERFGEPGTKRNPGLLYGISSHARDAYEGAVALADLLLDECGRWNG